MASVEFVNARSQIISIVVAGVKRAVVKDALLEKCIKMLPVTDEEASICPSAVITELGDSLFEAANIETPLIA